MKCLSLSQPMAWAVFNGKAIENRNWPTKHRGRIVIHAAKSFNKDHYRFLRDEIGIFLEFLPLPAEFVHGALIGEVDIVDCVTSHTSRWFTGKYGFVLANAKEYAEPIPYRGMPKVFEVPDDIVKVTVHKFDRMLPLCQRDTGIGWSDTGNIPI